MKYKKAYNVHVNEWAWFVHQYLTDKQCEKVHFSVINGTWSNRWWCNKDGISWSRKKLSWREMDGWVKRGLASAVASLSKRGMKQKIFFCFDSNSWNAVWSFPELWAVEFCFPFFRLFPFPKSCSKVGFPPLHDNKLLQVLFPDDFLYGFSPVELMCVTPNVLSQKISPFSSQFQLFIQQIAKHRQTWQKSFSFWQYFRYNFSVNKSFLSFFFFYLAKFNFTIILEDDFSSLFIINFSTLTTTSFVIIH